MYKSEWVKASEKTTKEKLGGKSDGALTVTKINELQKYYTYGLKSMQDAIQTTLYHCSSADQRPEPRQMSKESIIAVLF